MRLTTGPARACALASVIVLAACGSAPVIGVLPEPAPVDWDVASQPAEDLPVRALEVQGVRGGEIAAVMDGAPDQVLAMLLDFAHADGHRAWAEHFTLVSEAGDRVVAHWDFRGKMGIHPSLELGFEVTRAAGEIVVEFQQLESAFGLSAFFGDDRIQTVAGRSGCVLIERVFIDSGLPFVGASAADLEEGLRADIRRLREWLRDRTASLDLPRCAPRCGFRWLASDLHGDSIPGIRLVVTALPLSSASSRLRRWRIASSVSIPRWIC